MTAPAPRGTDPRAVVLEAHYAENLGLVPDYARRAAQPNIALMEAAGLIVALPDDALLEVIRDALDRHQYAQISEVAAKLGGKYMPYDELSERTRRIRHDQFIDAARAVLAALAGGAS